ncbi:MAG TPA: PilZ domain-containing protein [Bryobacteraceae bacterium]|nr:PilZ domain-containing protein [Bryobacteraceae bacterium]
MSRAVPNRDLPPTRTGGRIDLRRHRRYPIALEIQYKWTSSRLEQLGAGTTVNISSGGVLFRSAQVLPTRCSVELALSWPFSLNDCALKLVMRGRVVRSDDQATAVQVTHYEFRTAGPRRAAMA